MKIVLTINYQKEEVMSIKKCPVCGTELWADGHGTPDGAEFIGMPNAGYCPKCHKFYRWSTGEPVPDRYSRPTRISISVDGGKPVTIYRKAGAIVTFIQLLLSLTALGLSPFLLFIFFMTWAIEKVKDMLGWQPILFDLDDYSAFQLMTVTSSILTVGSLVAFAVSHSIIAGGITLWYSAGTLLGGMLLIFAKNFVYTKG